jgi:hypothetical protein
MPAQTIRTKLRSTGLTADELFLAGTSFAGSGAYKWAMPGSTFGEVVPATGASNKYPLGVAQNNPAAGAQVRVRVFGKTIVAASLATCNLVNGMWITVGSMGMTIEACGLANARWAGSTLTACTANTTQYGEIFLVGPSFTACSLMAGS